MFFFGSEPGDLEDPITEACFDFPYVGSQKLGNRKNDTKKKLEKCKESISQGRLHERCLFAV